MCLNFESHIQTIWIRLLQKFQNILTSRWQRSQSIFQARCWCKDKLCSDCFKFVEWWKHQYLSVPWLTYADIPSFLRVPNFTEYVKRYPPFISRKWKWVFRKRGFLFLLCCIFLIYDWHKIDFENGGRFSRLPSDGVNNCLLR